MRALVPLDGLFSDRASTSVLAEPEPIFNRTPRPVEWLTAPSSIIADGAFVDHLDPGCFEGGEQLDQRIDVAANHRFTRLHPLNGRHGKPGQFCQPALIDAEKHPGCPQLSRCDHQSAPPTRPEPIPDIIYAS